jgi:hypothetical protein
MPTTRQLRNARAFAAAQSRYDASEPRSFYDDDESPSWEECEDEARRQFAAEGYEPTANDVTWRATKLFNGEL